MYMTLILFLKISQLPVCNNWICICAEQEGEDAHGLLLAVALLLHTTALH